MNILHICANPRPIAESTSKQIAASFFAKLAELNPDINVTNVDLYHNEPPFVSNEALRYFWAPLYQENYQPSNAEKKAAAYALHQTTVLKEADVLVLTMPMWCNSMPAIMKAWLDQVIVPGQLFSYGPEGVTPMHKLQRVVLLISSGGIFKENDPEDGLTPALRATFSFIGVTEIAIAWADGQDKAHHVDADTRKNLALESALEIAEELAEMAQTDAPAAL